MKLDDNTTKQFRDVFGQLGDALGKAATKATDMAKELPKIMEQKKAIDTCVSAHLKSCVDVDFMMKIISDEMKSRNLEVQDSALQLMLSQRLGVSVDDIKTHQRMYGIHRRG
jgi:uncharacterized protein (DUF1697 family)